MHIPSLAEIRSRKRNSRNKMNGFVSTHIGGCLYIFHDMLRHIKNGLILLIHNYTVYTASCQQKNDFQTRFFLYSSWLFNVVQCRTMVLRAWPY